MHLPDPDQAGLFHIVGIGGIGMSAIAEVMHTRGYHVQGSDLKDGANLERLRARGITCLIGHDPENVKGAGHLVISSAVKAGNPEFEAAKERGLPIIRRAEMLAELMRPCATVSITGTHGKTTTTSLIADLLKAADLDPTVIAGGIINALGHQCPHRQGRVDGGRGRQVRRHILEASHSDRRRHQYRSRAYGLLALARRAASGLSPIHRRHPVLWSRRRLHRSSGGARAACQAWGRCQWPPHADLWRGARRRYQARQSAPRSQPASPSTPISARR